MPASYISETPLLDYQAKSIRDLINQRGWKGLNEKERIGAAYDFVRNNILFGYNSDDNLSASEVLSDGYGQCNTKGTLLMALLRALDIPCRFHGFRIKKALQRGIIPELIFSIAPNNIIHSWIEVLYEDQWINLEGFILDQSVLESLQARFRNRSSLCAYGAGTDSLQSPDVEWVGQSTYIQKTGINHDFGVFENPDEFYANNRQLQGVRGFLYRYIIRHWMNRRVEKIRGGYVPKMLGGEKSLAPLKPN